MRLGTSGWGEGPIELADQAGIESEAMNPVESALVQALELSAKDGSIVLSAGLMFVTAEVRIVWQKRESRIVDSEIVMFKSQ